MPLRPTHSYFVVMCDYGRKGLEAIVRPEWTRRNIVEMLKSGEFKIVEFIHHVDGLYIEDVTNELFNEAEYELRSEAHIARNGGFQIDHARDYRKHAEAAE